MTVANGALGFIPESHTGELFDQYDEQGQWKGCLNDPDVERLDVTRADYIEAAAGAITVHNCRTVHGSPPSRSAEGRALLLNAYASADAFPYTPHPEPAPHAGEVIRGQPARWAHHDPRPCLIPPDWSSGYTSIFAAQAGEDDPDAAGSLHPT
ncbi:MAG: phytanoyl-CoA dioxygenase family protein [Rhodospirillales bacterium]|nr:phytanoyl-CoA dioxygenase family protein [Rhodospirillales bacterium]